jgi:hypothetical protein
VTLFFDDFNRNTGSLGNSQTPGFGWGEGTSNCIEVDQRLKYESNCGDLSTVYNYHDAHDCPEMLSSSGEWRLRFETSIAGGHRLRVLVNSFNIAEPYSDGAGVIIDNTGANAAVGFCDWTEEDCVLTPGAALGLTAAAAPFYGEIVFRSDSAEINIWEGEFDTGTLVHSDDLAAGILDLPIEDPVVHVMMDPGLETGAVTWVDNLKFERIQ